MIIPMMGGTSSGKSFLISKYDFSTMISFVRASEGDGGALRSVSGLPPDEELLAQAEARRARAHTQRAHGARGEWRLLL